MRSIKAIFFVLTLGFVMAIPAFSQTVLSGLDGGRIDVQRQTGKVVVLAIGASWLPLSGKQAEYTNAIARKYQGRDVVVYFVATDSDNAKSKNFASNDAIKSFAAKNKLGVTVLRDSDGSATLKKFGVDQMPSFVLIDRSGAVSGESFGGIDPKTDLTIQIPRAIDKLLV